MSQVDFIYLDQTESTNQYLMDMASRGAPEGTAVAAGHQSKGRGRRGRSWTDEQGKSSLVSVLLRADRTFEHTNLLAPIVAVAVQTVLERECKVACKIKWPNDLVADGKKIAGILVECRQNSDTLAIVAGVGLNVLQTNFDTELESTATSVAMMNGRLVSPRVLSESLAYEILNMWESYKVCGVDLILDKWKSSMFGVGELCRIESGGIQYGCRIIGGNDDGSLRVSLPDGTTKDIFSADSVSVRFCANV